MGWRSHAPGTLLGYHYTLGAVVAIAISAVLGLLVSLSTFLFIGATSSLTYNVVGHFKTIIILTGGCLIFGDAMPVKKFLGVCLAMGGIGWYTQLKLVAPQPPQQHTPAPEELVALRLQPGQRGGLEQMPGRSAFTMGLGLAARHQGAKGGGGAGMVSPQGQANGETKDQMI